MFVLKIVIAKHKYVIELDVTKQLFGCFDGVKWYYWLILLNNMIGS